MRAMTLNEAKHDLERVVSQVVEDAEPAIIVGEGGHQVVLVPLDDYNAWQKTRYLLSNPANAEHLRRSIEQAKAGRVEEHELIEG
jgi:prevent-host-death family protein